jgi:predicted NBD/HSP70 family sugar kinase
MNLVGVDGKGSSEGARRVNRGNVLQLVRRHGPVARLTLARFTGLTEAAISRITRELINAGLLREAGIEAGSARRGRPSTRLEIDPNGAFVLGFDIGANGQWVSVANATGDILRRREVAFPSAQEPERFLAEIAEDAHELVNSLLDEHPGLQTRLLGGGIAAAGTVTPQGRTIAESPNLGWGRVEAADLLGNALNMPMMVESRPRALAMAESRLGDAPTERDLLVVLVGLGLGSCLMVDGAALRGLEGTFGHVAHLPVADTSTRCRCGARGCLDTVASGRAIVRALGLAAEADGAETASALSAALKRARGGDEAVVRELRSAGTQLGRTLEQLVRFANPQDVVVCGPVASAPEYVGAVADALNSTHAQVRASRYDVDAVAAWIALENFVYSSELDISALRMADAS